MERLQIVLQDAFEGGRPNDISLAETVMAPRFLTILTGRNLPKIRQPREPERSIINEKAIADFARVVEQADILKGATEPAGGGKHRS
jgi:hypothetical protein